MNRSFIRRQLLAGICEKMSDEERRLFMQLSLADDSTERVMQALARQQEQLDRMERRQAWYRDFGADVAANVVSGGLAWLAYRLLVRR